MLTGCGVLEPLELLERLAALVPPPRRPLLAYHGLLAPRARWRAAIVLPPAHDGPSADAGSRSPGRRSTLVGHIQPPINADGSSSFDAKRGVVPVKFTAMSGGVATCNLPPAVIAVTRTAGGSPGPINEAVYVTAADAGSNFRISDCQYVYNLAAKPLGPGTYAVTIRISGIVSGAASFQLN